MIGTILGGVLSLGGAIAGGVAASNASQRAAALTDAQKRKNKAWYDWEKSADYTQRADAQQALTRQRELFAEHLKNARGQAAVGGSTDEAEAIAKAAANDAVAQTTSNIAAQAASRKDQIDQQYRAQDAALTEQQRQTEIAKANAIAGAVGGVSKAGANLMASDASTLDRIFVSGEEGNESKRRI